MCDKGGECPLQNQAMSNGRATTLASRTSSGPSTKPINISSAGAAGPRALHLCAPGAPGSPSRSPGDPFIDLHGARRRSSRSASTPSEPFDSYFSRQHRADLPGRRADRGRLPVPVPPVRPGLQRRACASTARRAARSAPTTAAARCCGGWPATIPEVNEEWNCDKGRWAFSYATQPDRITTPADPRRRRRAAARVLVPRARRRGPAGCRRRPAGARVCWSVAG